MKPKNIKDLFEVAGNSTQLAASLNVQAFTVENWKRRGIPQKYFAHISKKYGISIEDIYKISMLCKESQPK